MLLVGAPKASCPTQGQLFLGLTLKQGQGGGSSSCWFYSMGCSQVQHEVVPVEVIVLNEKSLPKSYVLL